MSSPLLLKSRKLLELKVILLATGLVKAEVITVDHAATNTRLFDAIAPEGMALVAWARVRMEKYSYLFIGR